MVSEFFAMGGYAAYIWGSYAVAALILIGLLAMSLRGLRANQALLAALEAARPAQRRPLRPAPAGTDAALATETGE